MVAKITGKKPPVKPRRKFQSVKIAVNVMAAMFEMDDACLCIIGTVADDEHENVPAIIDGKSGKYVNLLTGQTSTLDATTFAFTADVWYVPSGDAFSFYISDKSIATVKRLDLEKIFGKEVVAASKIKLR